MEYNVHNLGLKKELISTIKHEIKTATGFVGGGRQMTMSPAGRARQPQGKQASSSVTTKQQLMLQQRKSTEHTQYCIVNNVEHCIVLYAGRVLQNITVFYVLLCCPFSFYRCFKTHCLFPELSNI